MVRGWKSLFFQGFTALTALVFLSAPLCAERKNIVLDKGWQFRHADSVTDQKFATWRPAVVPGCVHTDLLSNKLIDDPFYRDNESKLQWIEKVGWEYQTSFETGDDTQKRDHIELVFDGIDAYAEVYLNDKKILTADNMFRTWRVDVKPFLQKNNVLRVYFPNIIDKANEVAKRDSWFDKLKIAPKTYIRKAAFEYGWDWGPRFVTSGLWKPVYLDLWDGARIVDLHVKQGDISAKLARLTLQAEIQSDIEQDVTLDYNYSVANYDRGVAATVDRGLGIQGNNIHLLPGLNHINHELLLQSPALWWPVGYGKQPIYEFTANLAASTHSIDSRIVKTGLRKIELHRENDQWGRSFEFRINGVPVFGKGADVIPFDSFPTRVTEADYRRILQSAVDANMNMVRHWGGGYYESNLFYDLADQLGIMVWQDFMFGNDWQPGDYEWKKNVEAEAHDQLLRLRDHPSIIVWCGNNETEIAYNWDVRPKLAANERIRMWGDYISTFHGLLGTAVSTLTPETPYWPSSPSADLEDLTPTYQSGDTHNWNVWHGMAPLKDYEKDNTRFMTEYGFQSFPAMSTVEKFTVADDRAGITTPVMLVHQKNNAGNQKIHEYMLRDYPEPKDFASFLYVSQVLQAEAIKIGAEHLRRGRPRSMGSIFWQLNDCWPVASWSSVDYYGQWKALQYYARRFYAPVLVAPHVEGSSLKIYIVSDQVNLVSGELRLRVIKQNGRLVSEKHLAVDVKPLGSAVYMELPASVSADELAVAELTVDGKIVSRNYAYFAEAKQIPLVKAKIRTEIRHTNDSYSITLVSDVLARDVHVTFDGVNASVSDDYFTLTPLEPVVIDVKSKESLDKLKAALKVVSLSDAF